MKRFWSACVLMLLAAAAQGDVRQYKAGDLLIVEPWSQELPPGSPTAAVYFELRNRGLDDDTLTSVDTPIAAEAQLHQHINQDGMMKMQQVQGVTVPASGHAVFAPMAFHVMLLDLKLSSPLQAGQHFPVTLHFAKAGDFVVEVQVLKQAPAQEEATEHAH
ncbi:copper chaperone PCu(A)C [Pseudomonas sp. CFBP 13710]|uniref:copper chaperone PCu(A)C n=1 Tax=unclassified Pseudomonas TaxID=196821 RepID=UPI00406C7A6C